MAGKDLEQYKRKRSFSKTTEPTGATKKRSRKRKPAAPRFVVQEHHARRAALGSAPRARRRARLLGAAARRARDPGREPPRGPHRGPPARVPRLRTARSRRASTAPAR